jgi:DNA-binding IclR family transcriptional regulator
VFRINSCYRVEEKGFKIVDGGNKVYVHPLVSDHDIYQDSVVGGGMPLHTAGTSHSCTPLFVRQKYRVSYYLEDSNVENPRDSVKV